MEAPTKTEPRPMKPPRAGTLCHRKFCRLTLAEHVDGRCPKRPDRGFARYSKPQTARLSNSFTDSEADVAARLVQGLLRRQDLSAIASERAFATLAKKVTGMAAKARQRKGNGHA